MVLGYIALAAALIVAVVVFLLAKRAAAHGVSFAESRWPRAIAVIGVLLLIALGVARIAKRTGQLNPSPPKTHSVKLPSPAALEAVNTQISHPRAFDKRDTEHSMAAEIDKKTKPVTVAVSCKDLGVTKAKENETVRYHCHLTFSDGSTADASATHEYIGGHITFSVSESSFHEAK